MPSNSRQRQITIKKEAVGENCFCINRHALSEACKQLTPYELKVYLYLASNEDGSEFPLIETGVREFTGLSRTTFYDCVKTMILKGFIVHQGENRYTFYEIPPKE